MLFDDNNQLDETIQIIKFTNNTFLSKTRGGNNNITMDLSATHGKVNDSITFDVDFDS